MSDKPNFAVYGEGMQIGKWDALWGTLPFLLFGLISMLTKTELLFQREYTYLNYSYCYLAFYIILVIGFFIGLMKGVPLSTYAYLGWSLVLAWSGMGMSVDSFSQTPTNGASGFGWWSWLPLWMVVGLAILLSRSLRPLRKMVRDIWQDWTRLSLAMYAIIGFFAFVAGFDENHHPYLFALMSITAVVICGSVWFFMRSTNARKRSLTLIAGTVAAYIVVRISDATWNSWEYYGYAAPAPEPWYFEVYRVLFLTPILAFILFWPVLIGFVRTGIKDEEPTRAVS